MKPMHNGSDHAHTHGHSHAQSVEEADVLLNYLLDHNAHHAEELHALAHDLEHFDKQKTATLLHACVTDFESANAKLSQALQTLKQE